MAYSLRPGEESIGDGLRRVALSQIDTALAELDGDELAAFQKVHQIRKRCKKLRGLVRLARPGFADYRQENAAFRDLARKLSDLRDARTMHDTLDDMVARYHDGNDARLFDPIRKYLDALSGEVNADTGLADLADEVRDTLKAARERAATWSLDESGFAPVAAGAAKTYGRARAEYRAIDRGDPPDEFHQWRKRAKYHWYHARLMKRCWPELMAVHVDIADRLSTMLGDHHDLAVLREALAAAPEGVAGSEAHRELAAHLETRRIELESQVFALGAFLFAEKPKSLGKRWRAYWEAER